MEMTHKEILDQPNAQVSRLLTLLKLDNIRSNARNKSKVIMEHNEGDQVAMMYARWFDDIADQTNRAIDEINEASEEVVYG
jgi:hypothetical protein